MESSLEEVDANFGEADSVIVKLRKDLKLSSEPGPCQKSIDPALKQIGVEPQAYYGGTLIGNHCHQILKADNTQVLCDSIQNTVEREIGCGGELYEEAVNEFLSFRNFLRNMGNTI